MLAMLTAENVYGSTKARLGNSHHECTWLEFRRSGPVQDRSQDRSLVWSAVGLGCSCSRVGDQTGGLVFGLGGLGPMVLVPDQS
jgi:hypothetical protein